MGWRVSLTEQADHDLEDAVAFLAAKNQAAAERLGLGLVDSIFLLADFPLQKCQSDATRSIAGFYIVHGI
jgi:plasmid stabilization system protein ParE